MIQKKYINQLTTIVRKHFPLESYPAFVFGSSLRRERFGDVDVAIRGVSDFGDLWTLRSELEASTFPYIVDLVCFDTTEADFQDYVLNKEVKEWI